jgi:single-stranded DNA-binding protein
MEFEGVVFKKLPELSGTSAKGAWRKQDVVFELPGEFNRKVCVTFFGDRAEDAASLSEGDAVTVSVNVESREYNGKWYTDVKAWKIVRESTFRAGDSGGGSGGSGAAAARNTGWSASNNPPPPVFSRAQSDSGEQFSSSDDVDDLPF